LRGGRSSGTFLNHRHDLVALIRFERAELIFHIDTCLAAQNEQILAFHF